MRFCILGTDHYNSDELKTKKPVYQSTNLEETVRKFQQFINEVRYKRMYLVADFECYKKKPFTASVMTEDFKDTIPFIIIGEWIVGNDRDNWVRCDRMNLHTTGFKREFINNLAAVRKFIDYLNRTFNQFIDFFSILLYTENCEGNYLGIILCLTPLIYCYFQYQRLLPPDQTTCYVFPTRQKWALKTTTYCF